MKTKIMTFSVSLLISLNALAVGGQSQESKINEPAFISSRIEADLIKSIGPIDKKQLIGTWRKVLVGANRRAPTELGYYLKSGIEDGEGRDVLNLVFTETDMNWLPGKTGNQISAVPFGLPKVKGVNTENRTYIVSEPKLTSVPLEVRVEGDRALVTIPLYYDWYSEPSGYEGNLPITIKLSCGMQNDNPQRMLCEQRYDDSSLESYFKGYSSSPFSEYVKNAIGAKFVASPGAKAGLIGFEKVK